MHFRDDRRGALGPESDALGLVASDFRGIIDRSYPLEDIADAYRYVETGQKQGIVVINIVGTGPA